MKFKNDKERVCFLEDYRNKKNGWILWNSDMEDLGIRWWRYDFPDCTFVVEEWLQTFHYPKTHKEWYARQRYITRDDWPLLADQQASRTQQLTELKRIEKEYGNEIK